VVVVRVVGVVIVFVAAELFGISAAAAGSTYVAVAVASKIVKKVWVGVRVACLIAAMTLLLACFCICSYPVYWNNANRHCSLLAHCIRSRHSAFGIGYTYILAILAIGYLVPSWLWLLGFGLLSIE